MLSPADRIVEATMCHTLRPKKNNREKVIAAALRFVIEEFEEYREFGCGDMVVSCRDLWELIHELEDTETLEEPTQGNTHKTPQIPYNNLIDTEELQMTKVVYNACYGGFSLSNEAMDRMVELGYYLKLNPNYDPNSKNKYGESYQKYECWGYVECSRHDPILLQVVEELGDRASGECAKLAIDEVYGSYRIDEYDGNESVMTSGDYDWVTPQTGTEAPTRPSRCPIIHSYTQTQDD